MIRTIIIATIGLILTASATSAGSICSGDFLSPSQAMRCWAGNGSSSQQLGSEGGSGE